jgi:hypothetical protein
MLRKYWNPGVCVAIIVAGFAIMAIDVTATGSNYFNEFGIIGWAGVVVSLAGLALIILLVFKKK